MNERQTVLLVDDGENDIFLMRRAFQKAGINCPLQEVHNGEQAIDYLGACGAYADRNLHPLPSLVLLDLNMPMKNGFEVLAWTRSRPEFKCLSMVVLTASMQPDDVRRAFDLGATSYLVKPGSIAELARMIQCLRDWSQINHFPPLNDLVRR
jgi:CheY-like chemotaxis protein